MDTNRRGFFGRVIGGIAAAVLAPKPAISFGSTLGGVKEIPMVLKTPERRFEYIGYALEHGDPGDLCQVMMRDERTFMRLEAGARIVSGDFVKSDARGRIVPVNT